MAEGTRFRPAHRLGRAVGFSAVFANRRVLRGVLFDLHYRPGEADTARLGIVIPKRNANRAVFRNRLKRLVREMFRLQRKNLPRMDLVLRLARSADSEAVENSVVRKDIQRLLSRLLVDTSQ